MEITMERSTILNGKIHYKLPFSIAMLNHQMVGSINKGTPKRMVYKGQPFFLMEDLGLPPF